MEQDRREPLAGDNQFLSGPYQFIAALPAPQNVMGEHNSALSHPSSIFTL
jgi:hypothetical protein